MVHALKSESTLADKIAVGDQLISVDGEDVTAMTALQVSKMIALRSDTQRTLVFSRCCTRHDMEDEGGDGGDGQHKKKQ